MARGVKGPRRKTTDKQKSGFGGQIETQAQTHAEDAGSLGGWVNCECFFSLVLVALLAALPFNLQTHELMSQSKDSYLNRADALFSDGAFDKAASLYERAVNTEETAEGHLYLAEALVQVNRLDQAIKHYQRAAELFDQPQQKASMLSYLAKLHTEVGSVDRALESYGQILYMHSNHEPLMLANAHILVAEAMIDTFQHRAAIYQLQKALALVPDHAAAQLLLAHCFRDVGDFPRAIGRYKRLIQLQPRDFPAIFSLGMAYHEAGDPQPASAMFKRASTLNPNSSEVQLLLAALQQQPHSLSRTPQAVMANIFDLDAKRKALSIPRPPMDAEALTFVFPAQAYREQPNGILGQQEAHQTVVSNVDGDVNTNSVDDTAGEVMDEKLDEAQHVSHFQEVYGLRIKHAYEMWLPLLARNLGMEPENGFQWLDALELGCGRSMFGSHLRAMADKLQCIEPSGIAARQLQRQGHYDDIRHADVLDTLYTLPSSSMDLVVATEILPYFGNLGEVMQQLSRILRADGLLVFHTDSLAESEKGRKAKYMLQTSGRWAHLNSYVQAVVQAFELTVQESTYELSWQCQRWAVRKIIEPESVIAQ